MLRDNYIKLCEKHDVPQDLKKFNEVEVVAKSFITALVEMRDEGEFVEGQDCPYFIASIHDNIYYFGKVVDQTIFVNVMTGDELTSVGYKVNETEAKTGGHDEPYNDDRN